MKKRPVTYEQLLDALAKTVPTFVATVRDARD
jgi:hypothetical protein